MYTAALVGWAVFLVAAAFYTQRARNRETRPLAAYLLFVTVFSVTAVVLFAGLVRLMSWLGENGVPSHPLTVGLLLLAIFVSAFLVARWQMRKPPIPSRRP